MSTEPNNEESEIERYRCPHCRSVDTRYRSTENTHICQRCGEVWGAGLTKVAGDGWGCFTWGGIVFGVLWILGSIGAIVDGEPGPGILMLLVVAVPIGIIIYRKKRKAASEEDPVELDPEPSTEIPDQADTSDGEIVRCDQCLEPINPEQSFCGNCGTKAS